VKFMPLLQGRTELQVVSKNARRLLEVSLKGKQTSVGSSSNPRVIRCSLAACTPPKTKLSFEPSFFTERRSGVKVSGSFTRYVNRCFMVEVSMHIPCA
jgi:hypothetical protein